MLTSLPAFSIAGYQELLQALGSVGYTFRPVAEMGVAVSMPVVYLRHDIDMHIAGIEQISALEAEAGIRSTYYVPVSLHFNPLFPENRAVLRRLVSDGHEVGLHYDLETYPLEPGRAIEHLRWEAAIISKITEQPVRTICMHQPYKGQPDPFRSLDEFVHPHDPRLQEGLVYVSDSCRAWRDETLLRCFSADRPPRLLLGTHPEVWLGALSDRLSFLEQELTANGTRQHIEYFARTVRSVWETHPAPAKHDAREAELAKT